MLLTNAYLIDPKTDFAGPADIRIEDGLFRQIGKLSPLPGEEVLDLGGLTAAPGLIDTHVHFRDPGFLYKETLHTGALAAAKGGFTTVVCMANTKPVVDSVPVLTDILTRAKEEKIRICQAAAITRGLMGEELTDMVPLAAAGARGFTDDGIPIMNAHLLLQAMKNAAILGFPISLHEEDPSFITNNGINAGPVSDNYGIAGSPPIAEESLVARDLILALHTKAEVVIQHISSGTSVTLVRWAKSMGAHVHAEATPHHFTLTEDDVVRYGSLAKMNPPLRTEKDRQQIIEGLKDGTIDLIATDHAPHSKEEKGRGLINSPSGIIGLETSLALGITELVDKGHLTLMELLRKMTVNPAKLYRLPVGTVSEGAPADLVVFDPEEEWTVQDFVSKSKNSPFIGRTLKGVVHYTFCGGEIAYRRE